MAFVPSPLAAAVTLPAAAAPVVMTPIASPPAATPAVAATPAAAAAPPVSTAATPSRVRKIVVSVIKHAAPSQPLPASSSAAALWPASRSCPPPLLPLVDVDGVCKSLLHVQLEEALAALQWKPAANSSSAAEGEDRAEAADGQQSPSEPVQIGIVYSDQRDRDAIERYFAQVDRSLSHNSSDACTSALNRLESIGKQLHFIELDGGAGAGDAVWSAREFVGPSSPFLLLDPTHVHLSSMHQPDGLSPLRQLLDLHSVVARIHGASACCSELANVDEEEVEAAADASDAAPGKSVTLVQGALEFGLDLYSSAAKWAEAERRRLEALERHRAMMALQAEGISRFTQPQLSPNTTGMVAPTAAASPVAGSPVAAAAAAVAAAAASMPARSQGEIVRLVSLASNPPLERAQEEFSMPFGDSDFVGFSGGIGGGAGGGAHVLSPAIFEALRKQRDAGATNTPDENVTNAAAAAAHTQDSPDKVSAAAEADVPASADEPAQAPAAAAAEVADDTSSAAAPSPTTSTASTVASPPRPALSLSAALHALASSESDGAPCFGLLWLGVRYAAASSPAAYAATMSAFVSEGARLERQRAAEHAAAEAAAAAARALAAQPQPAPSPTVKLTNAAITRRTVYD